MNEPRICRDLYKVLHQHFPAGTKPTEDIELLISGKTDSTDRNGPVPSKTAAKFTVQASVQCQERVFLVDEAALR
jgi:hypothetical protein